MGQRLGSLQSDYSQLEDEFREALVESETKFEQLRDAFESAVREASALKQLVAHSQHDRDQQEFTGQELRCLVAEQKNKLNELGEKCAQLEQDLKSTQQSLTEEQQRSKGVTEAE